MVMCTVHGRWQIPKQVIDWKIRHHCNLNESLVGKDRVNSIMSRLEDSWHAKWNRLQSTDKNNIKIWPSVFITPNELRYWSVISVENWDWKKCKVFHHKTYRMCCFCKEFFESLAAEAKLDSEKSVMMKNAVHARKVIVRRAQTVQYETLRKQRESS